MEFNQSRVGLTEMINAMASQRPVYAIPTYPTVETYAQYPQYITPVQQAAFIPASGPHTPVIAQQPPSFSSPHPFSAVPHRPPYGEHTQRNHFREEIEAGDRRAIKDRWQREDRESSRERREYDFSRRDRRERRDYDRRDRRDSRERDRSLRDRSREKDRSPKARSRERRSRERSREKNYDDNRRRHEKRSENHYDEDHRDRAEYKNVPPSSTIMIKGLAQHLTESDVRDDIVSYGITTKNIKIVRKKDSGASRGFAFIEFLTQADAEKWMEAKQGILILQNVFRATLTYTISRDDDRDSWNALDWFCVKCGAHNFKRRGTCYKCFTRRGSSQSEEDGADEICHYPTNTLLLRGLDVLSTEENVLEAIQEAGSDLPIRSVRLGRDRLTNTSRGVCYLELNSVTDSIQLFNKLQAKPPLIQSKKITINYCKLPSQDKNSGNHRNSYNDYNQDNRQQPLEYTAGANIDELAEYSSRLYAKTPEEHATYLQYYKNYYKQQAQNSTQSDSANAAAAVAQSALSKIQSQPHKSAKPQHGPAPAPKVNIPTPGTADDKGEYHKYPTPDVSTYTYEPTSGYYYDALTGLYYDASTSYYYNSEITQYLYWDAAMSTYLPAPSQSSSSTDQNSQDDGDKKDKENKADKVKVAKKIAKDMERWAKALNKKSEVTIKGPSPIESAPPVHAPSAEPLGAATADAAFSILLEKKGVERNAFDRNFDSVSKPGLVAAYGEGSESEDEPSAVPKPEPNDSGVVDWEKVACLLCKRQFPSHDTLNKHVKKSDLHKKNLEVLRKEDLEKAKSDSAYRDRAKERRQKYGDPTKPPPNRLKERYMKAIDQSEAYRPPPPPSQILGEENIGNKMLKQMGWTDGQGLGRANQGRTEIIEAERRIASVGLGVEAASPLPPTDNGLSSSDNYKLNVKRQMQHRYQQVAKRY